MATLSFSTNFHGNLSGSSVPVEIRTRSLALVKLTNSRETVTLEPDMYVVKAVLPAGQEIVQVVDLKRSAHVTLEPEEEDRSPHEYLEAATFAGAPRLRTLSTRRAKATASSLDDEFVPESFSVAKAPRAWMRCVDAHALYGEPTVSKMQPQIADCDPNVAVASFPRAKQTMYLQLFQQGRPVVNVALPVSDNYGCRLVIHRETDRYWIEPQLLNADAMLLLGYRQNRALQHEAAKAEDLLRQKLWDPIGAAVGSYSLLSFGKLDLLHDWTRNLKNWMPWLPDGAAIRGEHLARLGEHQKAVRAFLEIEKRGLPVFTDGITMVYERLRLYTQMKNFNWVGSRREAAERLRDRIAEFIGYVDFAQPITTFTGREVTAPNDETWTGSAEGLKAVAVHQAFR